MRTIKLFLIIFSFLLLSAQNAYANSIWPALYLEMKILSWLPISAGLVIEYLFVRKLTGFFIKRSIVVDVSMNLASTLLGIVLIPLFGAVWEIFAGMSWLATFFLATLLNAVIETIVLQKIFKVNKRWSNFWWLFLANAFSVGLAVWALFLAPIYRY